MDSLLKAAGLVLYIVFSPLLLITEGSILLIQSLNYSFTKLHALKAKHKKQLTAFLKQHRQHFRWNLQRPGWLK
jgi:hypothetical protein